MADKPKKLINQDGTPTLRTEGLRREVFSDLYHHFLRKSWWQFLIIILSLFISVNLIFTFFYFECDGIQNAHNKLDYFFFSVQTLSTIGYGFMYPTNLCSHVLIVTQSFLGLLFLSFLTGLVFAKFSLPRAKILFTKNALVCYEKDDLTFKFRMTNKRANQIVDARIKGVMLKLEKMADGSLFRRIHDMKLVRNEIPMFSLSFTVQHIIEENSPFYQETHESLVQKEALVIITITGLDETMSQMVSTRHSYNFDEIIWGAQFKDVLLRDENGELYFNFHNFDEIINMK
jgi:inward rectifier potassium channel